MWKSLVEPPELETISSTLASVKLTLNASTLNASPRSPLSPLRP